MLIVFFKVRSEFLFIKSRKCVNFSESQTYVCLTDSCYPKGKSSVVAKTSHSIAPQVLSFAFKDWSFPSRIDANSKALFDSDQSITDNKKISNFC